MSTFKKLAQLAAMFIAGALGWLVTQLPLVTFDNGIKIGSMLLTAVGIAASAYVGVHLQNRQGTIDRKQKQLALTRAILVASRNAKISFETFQGNRNHQGGQLLDISLEDDIGILNKLDVGQLESWSAVKLLLLERQSLQTARSQLALALSDDRYFGSTPYFLAGSAKSSAQVEAAASALVQALEEGRPEPDIKRFFKD